MACQVSRCSQDRCQWEAYKRLLNSSRNRNTDRAQMMYWGYYGNRGANIWYIIYEQKQIEIQECEKSKFALFCQFFGVLVWKRARDFLLCVACFLSVIQNAPRGWIKTSLTEWPLLAPQTDIIYPFYRFYGYRIVLFYGYFFGPLTSGPLGRTSVRLYSV